MDMLCYCVGQRHNVASGPPKRRLSLFQEGRALGPSPTGFREALHGGEAVVATAGKFQGTSSASGPSSRGAAPLGSAGGEGEASGDGGASRYHLSTAPAGVGIAEQDDDTDSDGESTLRDTSPLHRFAQSVKGAMFAQEALREDAPDLASAVVFAAGAARQAPKVGRLETLDAFLIASPRGGQVQLPSPNMAVAGC
mmetsp:Transcript_81868/g.231775  ORF Transcript_81868/g.231775 Transcript_81868/m.231775 type:complete len:196 (-) Transcript_81868:20-607(-)